MEYILLPHTMRLHLPRCRQMLKTKARNALTLDKWGALARLREGSALCCGHCVPERFLR